MSGIDSRAARPMAPALADAAPRSLLWPVGGILLLLASLPLPRVSRHPGVFWPIVAAAVIFTVWTAALVVRGSPRRISRRLRANHYLQLGVQVALFTWWGSYWPQVIDQLPLIAVQLVVAYLITLLAGWSRYGEWRAGFGPFPPVLSINLFLWFRDPWFALQLGMIAVAFLSKDFVHWQRRGRRIHVFNPSGLALTVFSLPLILFGGWQMTWGEAISIQLGAAPAMYVVMAAASLLVQFTHRVVLITASAVLTIVALGGLYWLATGVYLFVDTTVPIAVFLGTLLLITDPVTSPHARVGQLIFGALYGASVVGLYVVLRDTGRPAYFDKLLFVPVLNLGVRFIDRVVGGWRVEERWAGATAPWRDNRLHVAAWVVFLAALIPGMQHHPGRSPAFWVAACAEARPRACENLRFLYNGLCEKGVGEACFNLGQMWRDGQGGERDLSIAAAATAAACARGLGDACSVLGTHSIAGEGVPADAEQAVRLFERACELASADGCHNLAQAHARGVGVPMDTARAAALFRRACDRGSVEGCGQVVFRLKGGSPAERAEAARIQARLCAGGHPVACGPRAER